MSGTRTPRSYAVITKPASEKFDGPSASFISTRVPAASRGQRADVDAARLSLDPQHAAAKIRYPGFWGFGVTSELEETRPMAVPARTKKCSTMCARPVIEYLPETRNQRNVDCALQDA
ncbi:predicted protein [Chaetomium globosum CBS 148.51]|uniref:Uncharacterized protein n=1 Tax=Chaetomium globosum (strain ATCC 6205 / CBS 148.51 / DSM 1962 / NBRC 6347 / NRRL 1970) TaxID=306901 RepID=Q2H2U0_CHAGB|nr:uncharacterized protein CHGG_03906 [Chaetomium globosum CBS 148.51]EAQ87287.1 predicted protein [Chaetomium globosum CBS 148.51]